MLGNFIFYSRSIAEDVDDEMPDESKSPDEADDVIKTESQGSVINQPSPSDSEIPKTEIPDTSDLLNNYFENSTAAKLLSDSESSAEISVTLAHLNKENGNRSVQCEFCGKTARSKADLIRHQRTHTGETPYSCDICSKQFTRTINLQRHMLVHTGVKAYTCEICGKQFSRADDLRTHQMIHSDMKPFSCKICGKWFIRKDRLEDHKKRRHSLDDNLPFRCDECSQGFRSRYLRDKHKLTHSFVDGCAFACDVCEKKFRSKFLLKKHKINSHTAVTSGEESSKVHDYSSAKLEELYTETTDSVTENLALKASPDQN